MAGYSDAARRLASAMADETSAANSRHRLGMVSGVVSGGAIGGTALVTVTVGGTAQVMPYLDTYTSPSIGDLVMVLLVDQSPLILGRVTGLPMF